MRSGGGVDVHDSGLSDGWETSMYGDVASQESPNWATDGLGF